MFIGGVNIIMFFWIIGMVNYFFYGDCLSNYLYERNFFKFLLVWISGGSRE